MSTRAIRDKNPGNIRPSNKYTWNGQVGVEEGYCVFVDMEHGIRAMTKDIISKINRGLNTIEKYIPVYAPNSDNNNTEGYIKRVADRSGIKRDTLLLVDYPTLRSLVYEHIQIEAGNDARLIRDAQIEAGVRMAFLT